MSGTPRTDKRLSQINAIVRATQDDTLAEMDAWSWARTLERESTMLQESNDLKTDIICKQDEQLRALKETRQ